MTGHVPFDACNNWNPPTCGNTSYDPLVDKLIGNAYHVVRTVYCNLGNLKLIYDFLSQYGMVLGVRSEDELKAMTTSATYVRWYGFTNTNQRIVTDYLYVEGDRTGILPDDATATGSWIEVAVTGSDPEPGIGTSDVTPYVYNNGSALGGETVIAVPTQTVGVPFLIKNHDTYMVGLGFEYDPATLHVTLDTPLEEGDEVIFLLSGTPAVPDNPLVTDWIQFNWLFNGGYATGGEQVIHIPYTFQSVPAIYKNGARFYQGLVDKSYTVDVVNQRILLTEPLAANDRLIVTVGGESRTVFLSDRSIEEIARAANVKDSEVIKSTDDTQLLAGKKIVYDEVAQKSYALPTIPANSYISSVSNGQLTYNPGNVTVDLNPVPVPALDKFALDLLSASGAEMLGYKLNLPGTTARKVNERLYVHISVLDFGAVGDWDPVNKVGTDDTNSFKNAMTALKLLGGGSLHIPAGNYLVRAVEIPSNVHIYGDGWASSLWQVEEPWNSTVVCFGTNLTNLNRPDFSQNTTDILIENIAFRRKNRDTHTSGTDVAQYRHLVSINATTRFAFEGCLFEGFNGDGIYIAGGVGTNEGHNFYGRVNRCVFEGIDMQNRNGVSIIDCEGLEISQSFFRACSSPYQPGPIDIEPNANTFHRIRDININNCRFVACGGGSAGLCIAIPDVAYGVRPTGITFKDNIIDGASHTTSRSAIRIMWGGLSLASQNLDVTISGNKITRCQRPFDISGTSNVRLLDNHFWDITNPAIIGVADTNRRCKNTVLDGNIFRDVGANEGACIAIFHVEDLLISNNQFRNIGKTTAPASGEVLIFKAGGIGSSIRIVDNTFINEGATITSAISSTGYTFTANSNEFRDNLYLGGGGLSNRNFPALYGNEGEVNYSPTVYGDTVEGTGTYTVRNGRYHIEGSVVHYRLNVTLSAHSGSGPMNVTLPTKCAVNGATAPMTAWVSGNIASAIGIAAARIDGGTLGAVGRARIYRADGAGNINISSAGTALSVEVSGTYHLDAA